MNVSERLADTIRRIVPPKYRPIRYLELVAHRGTEGRVGSGPFKGMKYGNRSVGSAFIPKLIGIYERELWDVVEDACAMTPSLVIDIGAAEGYYAVGLAMRLPFTRVIAFEESESGQRALWDSVALNGLESRV